MALYIVVKDRKIIGEFNSANAAALLAIESKGTVYRIGTNYNV